MPSKHNIQGPTADIHDWYKPTRQFILNKIKQHIKTKGTLLELGVNTGGIISEIPATRRLGLDLDKAAIAVAKRKGISAKSHDLNYPLPYPDRYVDNILCIETLEHVADYMGLLEECNRILKPGGKLIIAVPYHGLVKNIVSSIVDPRHFMSARHVHFFTAKYLIEDLEGLGFKLQDYAEFGRVPYLRKIFIVVVIKSGKHTSNK